MGFRVDESLPQLLIVYTGHDGQDYRDFLQHWIRRTKGDDRFGVIVVNEPHTHDDDDEDHEEVDVVKLINEFRREYRHLSNAKTIAYVNIYNAQAEWLVDYLAKNENAWETLQASAERNARYIFGTRGRIFTELEPAVEWVYAQANLAPLPLDEDSHSHPENHPVGLFFGSTTGVTEKVAYDIQTAWQAQTGELLEPINIGDLPSIAELLRYDDLILGVSTWNIGQLQDDWEIALPHLQKLDFSGKRIALFGIGDQYNYSDNFLDGLGILGKTLRDCGATLVGFWDIAGYEFDASLGVEDGQFMGLAIDEVHQFKLTQERIQNWVIQIIQEFELQVTAS